MNLKLEKKHSNTYYQAVNMPRKLPWAITISKPPASSPNSPPPKRRRISATTTPSSVPAKPKLAFTPATDGGGDRDVDLSKPVYMLPSDERYIMVEDEFLSIAQTYTRSLHRAEYERLQHLAKTTHARRITEIQRPVAGVQRMSKAAVLKKQESGGEEDAVVHSVWGKSSLGLLMCRPKDEERDLSVGWRVGARIRPAVREPRAVKREPLARPEVKGVGPAVKREPAGSLQLAKEPIPPLQESCTLTASEESSDDDLDAPVIRKNQTQSHGQAQAEAQFQAPSSSLPSPIPSFASTLTPYSPSLSPMPSFSQPQSSQPEPYNRPSQIKREIPDLDFDLEALAQRSAAYRSRAIAKRQAEGLAQKR